MLKKLLSLLAISSISSVNSIVSVSCKRHDKINLPNLFFTDFDDSKGKKIGYELIDEVYRQLNANPIINEMYHLSLSKDDKTFKVIIKKADGPNQLQVKPNSDLASPDYGPGKYIVNINISDNNEFFYPVSGKESPIILKF